MTRTLAIALLTLAAGAALPAAASATIVPQKSIAGIRLGMSEEEVRARLGDPGQTIRETNDFGPYTELVYRRARLRVRLQGTEEVTMVTTASRSERTSRGIRVGSSERSLRRHVRGVRCRTYFRLRNCVVGRELPGRTVTNFHMSRGRVARVTLGIVID